MSKEIKYTETQTNKIYRREAGICAFKVLCVTEEGIIIPLPCVFGEEAKTELPLSDAEKSHYIEGSSHADVTLYYTVSGGRASSFQAKYWGPTPPQFFPTNGEKISRY